MLKDNKYVDRLLTEWKQHGKIIISLDFDDTIYLYNNTLNNKSDVERAISLAKQCYMTGAYIVIFTASDPERYPEIQKYCEQLQIPINAINANPIELPYGKKGKIYYNINLCDRSGLVEAMDILESALYKYRGYQQTLKTTTDVA